jgi:hypothetical protein
MLCLPFDVPEWYVLVSSPGHVRVAKKQNYYHRWRLFKREVQFSGMPLPVTLPFKARG